MLPVSDHLTWSISWLFETVSLPSTISLKSKLCLGQPTSYRRRRSRWVDGASPPPDPISSSAGISTSNNASSSSPDINGKSTDRIAPAWLRMAISNPLSASRLNIMVIIWSKPVHGATRNHLTPFSPVLHFAQHEQKKPPQRAALLFKYASVQRRKRLRLLLNFDLELVPRLTFAFAPAARLLTLALAPLPRLETAALALVPPATIPFAAVAWSLTALT